MKKPPPFFLFVLVIVMLAMLACGGTQIMVEPMVRPTADIPATVCVVATAAALGGNTQ